VVAKTATIALACDIDHTLINQALGVLPHTHGGTYPGVWPPWPRDNIPTDPKIISDKLMKYIYEHRRELHITSIHDEKRWPQTASSLSIPKLQNVEAMERVIQHVMDHCRKGKAMLILSNVRPSSN
jgi:hypothetical protein